MNDNDLFSNLNTALNTSFITSSSEINLSAIDKQIQVIEDKKKEIITFANDKKDVMTLKDQQYLEDNIKEVIELSLKSLRIVQMDIRIGVSPRVIECFSQLSDSLVNQIRELRELGRQALELKLLSNGGEIDKPKNDNIVMSSSQLMFLISEAKNNSELNKIDAEFKIQDEDKE
jgi:hypothetical protein